MKNHNPYVGGVPDVWYSGMRADLWVEYKFIVIPKRDRTMIEPDLTGLQKDWLMERDREGRSCKVIVGCKEGGVIWKDWTQPLSTKSFREQLITRKDIARYITFHCS